MPDLTSHKTFKFKLRPTPEQAAQLDTTLRLCRELYNAALQERRDAWKMCGVSVNCYQQKAQLPEIRALREDCAAVHSQVLQDVVLRIDRAFKAFFRRVKAGEMPGYPRFVRHEAAFTTVVPGSPGRDPLFCQWFPTGTCVSGNAAVRSFRDKSILASADQGGVSRSDDCEPRCSREKEMDSRVNASESLSEPSSGSKELKRLLSSAQNGTWSGRCAESSHRADAVPPEDRRDLRSPVGNVERGNPDGVWFRPVRQP